MTKRTRKTPEQIYVDYWSTVPNWVEKMPLNTENLERFKKSSDFARLDLQNAFGVLVDELLDSPVIKALKKMMDKVEHPSSQKPFSEETKKAYAIKQEIYNKKSETCSED